MTKNKFQIIYDDLAEKIQKGQIPANDLLPSENELALDYQASRETIRKALKLLSEHGFIQKIQGKGSVVLEINKINFPISGLVSFHELAEKLGKRAKTTVVSLSEQLMDETMKAEFQSKDLEAVWKLIRVRTIDEERIILDKDFLLSSLVPGLTSEIGERSIYAYIENELGLTISFAQKEITVEVPTEEDYQLLDLNDYNMVVVVKSHVYLDDVTLFQYTESRHRPDKFRFVDFARRQR
ncbi:trehalose operon repressor [Halalkalibacter akibai]|uniref:Trehalose operon repressor n=1 Tax=Halalkalibacter akibai (strain ATCC 43226 / DSM 21942 / CIP 109018 / JCM 9157 / 1139) TaxID=1236973 RepID=W4R0D9_HALA3|nr:trehalose operon repressor [Halalkalibacter akibai]GAE37014.1 trehalose operon transcriptional repressor [Halalkalibacter akibai JCM 9157]